MPTCPECGYVLEADETTCPQCGSPAKGRPAQAQGQNDEQASRPAQRPRPRTRTELIGASAFAIIAIGVLVFMLTHTRFGPRGPAGTSVAASTSRAQPPTPTGAEPAVGAMAAEGSAAPMASAGALPPSVITPGAGGYEQPEAEPAQGAEGEPAPAPEQPGAGQAGNELTLPGWIVRPGGLVEGSPPETEASGTGAAEESSEPQPETAPPEQPEGISRLLRYCPFDLRPGMEIGLRPGMQPAEISFQGAKPGPGGEESLTGGIICANWTVRGTGGGALRLGVGQATGPSGGHLWVDQPFEVLQNGRLVGSFGNTDEYWQALRGGEG